MRDGRKFSTARAWATAALILAVAGVVGPAVRPAVASPIGWQVSGGLYTDESDFFLGAGARFSLARFTIIPNGEWIFVDNGSAYTLNLDGTMGVLHPIGIASAYIGAGLGLFTVDPDGGDSNTDTVVNLMAGVGLNASPLKPFAQVKWIVMDGDDPLVLSIGARFP